MESTIESTGSGALVSLVGTSNGTGGNDNLGIDIVGATAAIRSSGELALTGIAGNGIFNNDGIRVNNGGRVIAAGMIDLAGTGSGSGNSNNGIQIIDGAIESTGLGNIALIGNGVSGDNNNPGVLLSTTSSTIRTGGNITLVGTGNGIGTGNDGIEVVGIVESTGASSMVSLMGTSNSMGNGDQRGIDIVGAMAQIRSGGSIVLTGSGSNGVGNNFGIALRLGPLVQAGGNITATGTGGNGSSDSNHGILVDGTFDSTSGAIALTGIGGSGVNNNEGINVNSGAMVRSGNGNITLVGTGNGTGTGNEGIAVAGTIASTGTGSISLTGAAPPPQSAFQLDGTFATNGQTIALNVASGDLVETSPLTVNGSNITIENLGGNIELGDVSTSTAIPGANAGNITLTASSGNIVLGNVSTSTLLPAADAGNVMLTASNNITATSIDTESDAGRGGNVRIVAGQSVRITGFFTASNGIDSSISTVGTPSGTIFIQHGGNGMTSFDVGNAATNGTANALTRGSVGESVLAPNLPATSFLNNHTQDGGDIEIRAIAPPASLPAPETEAETEAATELEMLLEIPPDVLVGAETSPSPTPGGLAPPPSPIGEPAALPESTIVDGARVVELEPPPDPPFLAVTPPEPPAFALPEVPSAPTPNEPSAPTPDETEPAIAQPNNLPAAPPAPEPPVETPVLTLDQNPLANDLQGTGSIGVVEIVATSEGLRIESRASSEVASPTVTIAAENDRASLEVGPAIARRNIRALLDAGDVEAAVVKVDRLFTDLARIHVPPPYPNSFNATQQFRDALQEMWERTGKKPAIVYTVVEPDRLGLIFVAPDNEAVYRQVNIPSDRLQSTISAFRDGMLVALRRRIDGHLQPAQELYDWLIAPLEADLEAAEVDTLLFSMDGSLRSLPIAALHDGEAYLVEKFALGLIPSLNLTDISYRPLQNASVLAMGASRFESLPPLPGVPLELSAIVGGEASASKQEGVAGATTAPEEGAGDAFPPENRNVWIGSKLLDENFTLANLLAERDGTPHAIVHFATHAEFQSDDAEDTYIQLWDERLQFDRLRQLDWQDPPVELLVLSACRTAVGDESSELGFAGLAVRSGIKSVLASLWYVSDAGTLALMDGFYDRLSQEDAATKAEALRQAQLALLRGEAYIRDGKLVLPNGEAPLPPDMQNLGEVDFSNPFYWSGFILVGSPW